MISTPNPSDQTTQPADADAKAFGRSRRPEPLRRGAALGRYIVLERLGVGGMGEVFAAYDPELDRKIAVKLLRSSAGKSRSAGAERLVREAKAMARLSHRNVITVHDVGTHAGHVFVAMEHVDGGTLGDWLEQGPHRWPKVLERFKAAGAGLAAAHAEGLVHRDFKPANVLLGTDGRVRVADFGLARRARDITVEHERRLVAVPDPDRDPDSDPDPDPDRDSTPAQGPDALAESLTQTGLTLGTPAYMAPEQYGGREVDARADQFSFCVALYEALYGERPFVGESLHVIMFAVAQGRINDAPPGNLVPGWLRRVLIRGLAYDPEQRWPSMDALLAQVRRDPAQLRRRGLVLAGALGLVLAGIGFGQRMGSMEASAAPVCVGAELALGDAFDSSDRAAIEQRFTTHDSGQTAVALLARLDQWAQDWQHAWVDACQATRVRGEQSEDLLDRRMACLDLQRSRFTAFVDTMAQADQAMARGALNLLGELDNLAACSDRAALLRQVPLPTEPERVAAIREAESVLEQARLLQLAGRPRAAATLIEQQRPVVERADWGPLTGVFLSAEALQRFREDQPAEGRRLLKRAFATALSVGDDRLARAIARRVAVSSKDEPERALESLEWLEIATALAIREGSDDSVLAQLALVRSQVLVTLGDYEQARDAASEGLTRLTRAEPEGMSIGSALYQIGASEVALGRHAEASDSIARAEAVWMRELSPDHLNVLTAQSTRGVIARETGDLAGARAAFEHVLAVKRENYGPDGGETLISELELGETLAGLAKSEAEFEQALELANHVLSVRRDRLAPEHSLIGDTLIALAEIERRAGKLEQAHIHAREGEAILRAVHDPEHPKLVAVLQTRGEIERERGQYDESRQSLLEAKDILERRLGLRGLAWRSLAAALAETERRAGRPEQALQWLNHSGQLVLDEPGL